MVCALSIVVASCGGRSTNADRIAQLEDSIAKLNSPKYEEKATDSKEEVRTVATEENAQPKLKCETFRERLLVMIFPLFYLEQLGLEMEAH